MWSAWETNWTILGGGWGGCTCIQQGIWSEALGLGFHLILCSHLSGKSWQLCPLEQLPAPLERGSPRSVWGRGAGRVTGCYEPGTKKSYTCSRIPAPEPSSVIPTRGADFGEWGTDSPSTPSRRRPLRVINEWTSAEWGRGMTGTARGRSESMSEGSLF